MTFSLPEVPLQTGQADFSSLLGRQGVKKQGQGDDLAHADVAGG
ncbi:MAG TPA: hypothetical protein VFR24_25400 [Candidatus Angelobacter sp.]|nr:hypothetical protein [Candidatus Angelobacter sp.]